MSYVLTLLHKTQLIRRKPQYIGFAGHVHFAKSSWACGAYLLQAVNIRIPLRANEYSKKTLGQVPVGSSNLYIVWILMSAMSALTKSICWKMINKTNDTFNQVGLAIFRKPSDNQCYEKRMKKNPPLCKESDDPDAAWNVPLQACMHKLPVDPDVHGSRWPEQWPLRLEKAPYWLNNSQAGVYGKPALKDFEADHEHWKRVVSKSYVTGMGINWSHVRIVMDMRSVYGGFAAALRDMKVWVMNIVSIDSPDTLAIIYERGLFGMYHDWCESFSTYPRTYDLLHADHLFSKLKNRCKLQQVIAEVDRILRPEGNLIVRDNLEIINEIENMAKSLHWEIRMTYSKDNEGLLCVQKTMWRPKELEARKSSMY